MIKYNLLRENQRALNWIMPSKSKWEREREGTNKSSNTFLAAQSEN